MKTRRVLRRAGALIGALGLSATALGGVELTTAQAGQAAVPMNFAPETSGAGAPPFNTQTYALPNGPLHPKCPNALAATKGSDPASDSLNTALVSSTEVGGVVHYVYNDNGHIGASFDIQDCEVVYPSGTFTPADFGPGGVLLNFSKGSLNGGTEIDGAELSGTVPSAGNVFFLWTVPNDPAVTAGTWVCNYSRDIGDAHSGGGNRKTVPVCFQVTAPDLAVGKSTASTVQSGGTVVWSVTVTNSGTGPASNVVMTDAQPANTTFASIDTSGASGFNCTHPSAGGTGTITCTNPGPVAPGTTATFSITDNVAAGLADGTVISNTAGATADSVTADADDSKTANTTVKAKPVLAPDLLVNKSAPGASVVPGPVVWTIQVSNSGNATETGPVTMTDDTPANMSFGSLGAIPTGWTCQTPLTAPPFAPGVQCVTTGNLTAGPISTFLVTDNVANTVPDGTGLTNTAGATAADVVADADDTSTAATALNNPPAISILKTGPASVQQGDTISWTIQVSNVGGVPAPGVVMTDATPVNTTFQSVTVTAPASYNCVTPAVGGTGNVICTDNAASLAPGASDFFTITDLVPGTVAAGTTLSNTAGATARGAPPVTDTATSDVTAPAVFVAASPTTTTTTTSTTTTTTLATCPPPEVAGPDGSCVLGESLAPDPIIKKTADAASVNAGQPIGFTITLTNSGNVDTTATITDPLPAAAGLVWSVDSQPASGPTCSIANGTLTCGPADIAAGGKWSVHVISPTTSGTCGRINNTATVSSPNLAIPRTSSASEVVTCVLGVALAAPTGATPAPAALPFTGLKTARLLGAGAGMALIGVIMMMVGRRRPEEEIAVAWDDPLGRL